MTAKDRCHRQEIPTCSQVIGGQVAVTDRLASGYYRQVGVMDRQLLWTGGCYRQMGTIDRWVL